MIAKQGPVIAIDGPAGTGKSSATKRLSDRLGFIHVDTGALYRAVAYLLIREGQESNEKRASELSQTLKLEFKRDANKNPANRIFANGEDLTPYIRTPDVSMAASRVSAIPGVRTALLSLQRAMGAQGKTILEGRDIGTVIFPDADVKFFLTASIEERAKRRLAELEASGVDTPSFEEVKNQIAQRDAGDMSRSVAPLKQAVDAVLFDTSQYTLDQVVDWMEQKVRAKLKI